MEISKHIDGILRFDRIVCEHPLPLPDEEELQAMDWDDYVFITDKLNCADEEIDEYQIGDNGFIYKKEENGICQQELTRDITFFGLVPGEEHDYALEFCAFFYKGELKELELESFNKVTAETNDELRKKAAQFIEGLNEKEVSLKWHQRYLIEPIKMIICFPFYILFIVCHYIAVTLLKFLIWIK